MNYLYIGEWWIANVLFGVVFIVAGAGITGIAWYVLKHDRLNRIADGTDLPETAEQPTGQVH